MPHPIMFREDDPVFATVRAMALAFPDAYEKVSHGRPAFFATKMFPMYGGTHDSHAVRAARRRFSE